MNLKGRLEKLEQRRDDNHPPERIPVFTSPGDDEKMAAWAEENPGGFCYNVVCQCGRVISDCWRFTCSNFGSTAYR